MKEIDGQSSDFDMQSEMVPLDSPSPFSRLEVTPGGTSGIRVDEEIIEPISNEVEVRLQFSEELHQYIREYIILADQKAAFFFTVSSALVAFIDSQGHLEKILVCSGDWVWRECIALLSVAFLLASILFCLAVVVPRLSGAASGAIFFNAIASYSTQQKYVEKVISLSTESMCEEKLKHCFDLSIICSRKYRALFWAIWSGAIGVLLTAALVLIG